MSILGVVVRVQPADRAEVVARLRERPGVDVAIDAEDGRLVLVIEDTDAPGAPSAAATLGELATWPQMLSTSLVYEYSGPDAPSPDQAPGYQAWRGGLAGDPRVGQADRDQADLKP